ncbi:MAG: hypothetical protein LBC73_08855 [Oscillospiraceae bacterium]|jgi:hypothetical protein|nr:hypothetical protein [Oscillospiraceae bacterium]
MSSREYAKTQIDVLPEDVVEKIIEFISFQLFSIGMYDNDTEYLSSIPGMKEKIKEGMKTPLSECVSIAEVWADV